jgi:hypothetical protein
MENEIPTTLKSNAAGKTLVIIAWILIVLHALSLWVILTEDRYRDPSIEALLAQPSQGAIGGTIGYLIGINILSIAACVLSLTAWLYRKNKKGKVSTIFSIFLMITATLLAFLPSSRDKNVDKEMLIVKQMSDEVISAWDNINRGQLVEQKKFEGSEYGNVTPFMQFLNEWIMSTQAVFLKMTTEIQQCNLASTCKPETLTDPILLSKSRLSLQKFKNILQSYEPQIKRLFNEFPQKLAQLDIGENVKKEAIVGYNKSKDKALAGVLEFFEIEYKIAATAEALMDFMKSKQGQVRNLNNQLFFDSQADADIYNNYLRDISKLAEAEMAWKKKVQRQGFIGAEELQEKMDDFIDDDEPPYYVSKEHNFKVRYPGKVDVTDYGMITHYTSEVEGEAAYNVFVNKYPKPVLSDEAVNAALEGYVEGRLVLFGDKAKLIESNHIYLRGHKALEYEYTVEAEGSTGYFKGVCVIVGKLGYGISVVCEKDTKTLAYSRYDKFLKSFRLMESY